MENHHAINGKIHYFYGHFQLLFVCSPEGTHNPDTNFPVLILLSDDFYSGADFSMDHLPDDFHFRATRREKVTWCKVTIAYYSW